MRKKNITMAGNEMTFYQICGQGEGGPEKKSHKNASYIV